MRITTQILYLTSGHMKEGNTRLKYLKHNNSLPSHMSLYTTRHQSFVTNIDRKLDSRNTCSQNVGGNGRVVDTMCYAGGDA